MLNHRSSRPTTLSRVGLVATVVCAMASCGSDDVQPSAPTTTTAPTTTAIPTSDHLIVYQGPGGILMTVHADGTGRADLRPQGAENANHPDWSPDGSRLTFVEHDTDGTTDIWVSAADGTDARELVDCVAPCEVAEDPAWSPDGHSIAYYTFLHQGPEDLRIVDVATGTVTRSIPAGEFRSSDHPRWSPDGTRIVVEAARWSSYTADAPLEKGIAVVDLTESTPTFRTITDPSLQAGYPGWSPVEDLIVFHGGNPDPFAEGGPPSDIYVIAPDGTGLRRVHEAPPGTKDALPSWSTDGRTILLTTIRPELDYRLARLDLATGVLTELKNSSGLPVIGAHTIER